MTARPLPALICALLAGALTGCSQIAAIAPVGGDHQAEVRYAAIDVLLDAGVEILEAPVCEEHDGAVTCAGETLAGERITVESTAADEPSVRVAVGAEVIYSGPVLDVLDEAAREEG